MTDNSQFSILNFQFVDTHCHIYDEAFDADRDQALQRAIDAGVTTLLLPDIDSSSTPRLDALVDSLSAPHAPLSVYPMAGLHPTSVKDDFEAELQHVHNRLFGTPFSQPHAAAFVSVGEIGMDLYWDRTYEAQQREVLKTQLLWAEQLDLPVCLHIRKAHNEVFALLHDLGRASYRGVMHCFGGSVQEARRAVEMGFHLGIGGVVTFKNATLADVVSAISLEHLLLETDAPYLSPVPHRGQRNEPAYIPLIAQRIADIKGIPLAQVAEQTTANARALFRLP